MPSTAPSSLDPETRHVAELLDHPVRLSEYRTRFPFLVAGPTDPTWQKVAKGIASADLMPELKARFVNYPPRDWALVRAGLGRRFLSFLVDVPLYFIFFGLGAVVLVSQAEGRSEDAMGLASVAWLLVSFFLYFVATEWRLSASPGGFLAGIRVVNAYGGRPTLGQCLGRQFTRIFRILLMVLGAKAAAGARNTNRQMAGGAMVAQIGASGGADVVRA